MDYERRQEAKETAERIAVLESRTDGISKVVERIEKKLDSHTKEEIHNINAFRNDLNEILVEFKENIEEKFEKSVTPLKDDLSKLNYGYRTVIWILSAIGAIVLFFKDVILKFLGL